MQQDPYAGKTIENKYQLDRKIGEGGMGAVYLGTQLMVDRPVAIKLLHAGLNSHDLFKQRFEVEAKAIGRLNHPNCITLYDFGFSEEINAFYTVMEYLEGDPMQVRVMQGVTAKEAVVITKQIAMALDHAHHQGILHRDLKPENIILAKMTDGSELTKVLDFGIARVFQKEQDTHEANRLTRAGEVFGTPAYISPEQARGERDLTPASDLYSLGVMLFEMLEGRLPFWGDTAIDTIMLHIQEPVPNLTRIDVPAPLRDLVKRLMAKNPADRYQSGKELAEHLKNIELMFDQRVPVPAGGMIGQVDFSGEFHAPASNLTPAESEEWASAPATVVAAPRAASLQTIPPTGPFKVPGPDFGATPVDSSQTIESIKDASRAKTWLVLMFVFLFVGVVAAGAVVLNKSKNKAKTTDPAIKTQPAIKTTPRVLPKVTPKIEPKVEPKDTPKVEPKDTPKVEPKVIPLQKDELPKVNKTKPAKSTSTKSNKTTKRRTRPKTNKIRVKPRVKDTTPKIKPIELKL